MNRINLITLGVKDMKRSLKFYRALGFETSETKEEPSVVFFRNGGTRMSLYPLEELGKDIRPTDPPVRSGFSGITLAYNGKSVDEVDIVMKKVEEAGGTIVKPPEKVFWGGYSGYFTDPDGYYWEVAYGEMWQFDENDMLIIE